MGYFSLTGHAPGTFHVDFNAPSDPAERTLQVSRQRQSDRDAARARVAKIARQTLVQSRYWRHWAPRFGRDFLFVSFMPRGRVSTRREAM